MLATLIPLLLAVVTQAAIVPFTVLLTQGRGAPDGVARDLILINGTSPGPALLLDEGDTVQFLVLNNLSFPTTIHFHGITQLNSPWSDGVPGLSQRPIPAGGQFLYKWTADEYGTYWYHSHAMSQISDGLFGPIHIRASPSQPNPFRLISANPTDIAAMTKAADTPRLVMVADWDHLNSSQKFAASQATDYDLYCVNSIIVNGRGNVNCLPQQQYMSLASPDLLQLLNGSNITTQGCTPPTIYLEQGNFTHHPKKLPPDVMYGCNATTNAPTVFNVKCSERWASFNFIGATAIQTPVVSIDDHEMWIYAADGRYIVPQLVNGFQINNGQRYAAMVRLKSNPPRQAYTMRFAQMGLNQIVFGQALLSYADMGVSVTGTPVSEASYNYAAAPANSSIKTFNETMEVPFSPIKPAGYANATRIVDIGRLGASWRWTMSGNKSYPQDAFSSSPLLYYPNGTKGMDPNLIIRTKNNTWIDIVLVATLDSSTPTQPPHSFHKHSNKAFVIGSGTGPFKWNTVSEAIKDVPKSFNLLNPPYRDSFVTPPVSTQPTWLAIRYYSMNPGAWFMHCHIQPHLAGGMAMAILDGVDTWPTVPTEYRLGGNGM